MGVGYVSGVGWGGGGSLSKPRVALGSSAVSEPFS